MPIDTWGEETLVPVVPPHCDPADPGVCDFEFAGSVRFTSGTFSGEGPQVAHHRWDPATNSLWVKRVIAFTGTLGGCGSGSVTLVAEGHFAPDLDGGVRLQANVIAAPGSASSGLAGLLDLQGVIDQPPTPAFDHQPFAHVTGTMWCL